MNLGLITQYAAGKNYVLDTNVLLHDSNALDKFKENHVCILVDVLSELDKFKVEQSERGANARRAHRKLSKIFKDANEVTFGVSNEYGGSIRLVINDGSFRNTILKKFYSIFPEESSIDNKILATACLIKELNENIPTILVTKDINMQLKSKAVGIECQDYLNDKVDSNEVKTAEYRTINVSQQELQRFASSGVLEYINQDLIENEYVLLASGEKQTIPARYKAQFGFIKLFHPERIQIENGKTIKPLNLGQRFLLDAIFNPDISIVTCYGHAGTGKTLLAVAAGLSELFSQKYDGLIVSRPVVPMGDQIGFLPGTLEEKMNPWLQPIYDSLDLIMRREFKEKKASKRKTKEETESSKPYQNLLDSGIIEIEALCYIRGRSIPNRFFILDEAQQLTPSEAKTIVTRMSSGSKLILVGDPNQIDNPYVDSQSNGLVYTRNRLKDQKFSAHVNLLKGERSELAEAGAKLM